MTEEEKRRQVAVGKLLRERRKSRGYTIEEVVTYCRKVGWHKLNAHKLNSYERGASEPDITGLKTLMAFYGISTEEIVEVK